MNINLPWKDYYVKTNNYKCNKFLEFKQNFKIENYIRNDLKIFSLIFNFIKRKSKDDIIDYKFYNKLIIQEINNLRGNKIKMNLDLIGKNK